MHPGFSSTPSPAPKPTLNPCRSCKTDKHTYFYTTQKGSQIGCEACGAITPQHETHRSALDYWNSNNIK